MNIERHRIDVTTDASGDFEGSTAVVNGRVLQVRYVPDGSSPLDTGADLDIVTGTAGVVIANEDNIGTSAFTRCYRQPTQDATGTASLTDDTTGEPVEDYIWVAGETIGLTIANGGNAKSGTFYIYVG